MPQEHIVIVAGLHH